MVREHHVVQVIGKNYSREYANSVMACLAAIATKGGFKGIIHMNEKEIIEAFCGGLTREEARQLIQTAYNGIRWHEEQVEIPKA